MRTIFLLLLLFAAMISASSATVSISIGDGHGTIQEEYNLDSDTSLLGSTTINSDGMVGSRDISGNGDFSIASNDRMLAASGRVDASIGVTGDSIGGQVNGIDIEALPDVMQSVGMLMPDGQVLGLMTGPTYTASGGRSSAYSLMGIRWNTRDPRLKLVLKNDANLAGEGLSTSAVHSAITAAANTWDDATNQNLFADSSTVALSPSITGDSYNGMNTVIFKPASIGCLAYSRSYFRMSKVDGYYSTLESDLVFNTRYTWRTDGSNSGYDVQSVALHELGHTLGLGDLYNKAAFKCDLTQVMNRYTGVKRTLGNGDKTGIWNLYG